MADKKIDWKKFIIVWQRSESLEEAASKMGLKKERASLLAALARKNNVNLKPMPRGKAPIDWKTLAKLVK